MKNIPWVYRNVVAGSYIVPFWNFAVHTVNNSHNRIFASSRNDLQTEVDKHTLKGIGVQEVDTFIKRWNLGKPSLVKYIFLPTRLHFQIEKL